MNFEINEEGNINLTKSNKENEDFILNSNIKSDIKMTLKHKVYIKLFKY